MTTTPVMLVGGDETAHSLLQDAVGLGLGPATIHRVHSLDEILSANGANTYALIVLVNPDPDDLACLQRREAADGQLPWPVVILGSNRNLEGAEALAPEEWRVPVLAKTLKSAWAAHRLNRGMARAREDLLSVGRRVFHDLRTPLGAIRVSTEALREELGPIPSQTSELLTSIEDSSEEIARMMDRIAIVLKATARPTTPIPVNLAESVAAACDRHERGILHRRATLIQDGVWPMVCAVPLWLETIWCELLANALEHTRDGVRILVGCEPASPEGHRCYVADNGPGIQADRIRTLFHPFHRRYEPDAPHGLGLAVVERLVTLQGGQCGYRAQPDGGACFTFVLPAAPPEDPSASIRRAGSRARPSDAGAA